MIVFAATAEPLANVWTPLHTVAVGKSATANINIANDSATDNIEVRVAVSATPAGDAPTDAEIMEPGTVIPPKGILKLMGEPMAAGETVKVYVSALGASVRHSGFER